MATMTKRNKILIENPESIAYYQVDILNELPGNLFAHISIGYENDKLTLFHDTSGMKSLVELYEKTKLQRDEGIRLLKAILHAISFCCESLLNPSCILFSADKIFVSNSGSFTFIYTPFVPKNESSTNILPKSFIDFILLSGEGKAFSTEEAVMLKNLKIFDSEKGNDIIDYLENRATKKEVSSRLNPAKSNIENKTKPFFGSFGGVALACILLLLTQGLLLLLAFLSLRNYENFHYPIIPLIIVLSVLLFIGLSDAVLLFNKNSPLKKVKAGFINKSTTKRKENSFSNDEKTTFIDSNEANKRIAMLCSEIPGTPNEAKSHKGYILVDDFIIGRDKTKADFRIDSMTVGRIHARILRKDNLFFIEDMGSRNGTFLNAKKLKKNVEILLPDKCKISFADMQYYFVVS